MKNKKSNDGLGDRMKKYESSTCSINLMDRLPIIARCDGRSFSIFTKGLKRPYDERLSRLMIETTKYLVKETNANCGYVQSDEISLVWYNDSVESEVLFKGKLFKMLSTLSALATGFFNKNLSKYIPEKSNLIPTFDCRVFNVPTLDEAANCLVWRELDATKNSITMASRTVYSDKEIFGKNGSEKQEMLFQKGINWNDYPAFFKRGTYVQRKRKLIPYTAEELSRLPEKHNARKDPDYKIERWSVEELVLPPILTVANRIEVILFGADVITKSQEELLSVE